MRYRVVPRLFHEYPSFCRAVVVATHIDNTSPSNAELESALRERVHEIEIDPAIGIDHPRINAWREIYLQFRQKESQKIQPSIGALVRRIKKGKGASIPFISPLVCISNLTSLSHLVPSGLIDSARVKGDLVLGYANGTERFLPIGNNTVVSPEPGEIIYYDDGSGTVMCRAWNSKGGQDTFILPTTKSAVIDIDGLLDVVSREEIESAASTVASLVTTHCGGNCQIFFLEASKQEFDAA